MASAARPEKPLKKQVAAVECEVRAATAAARSPQQKAAETRYQKVLAAGGQKPADDRMTSSQLLRRLKSVEPLAVEGWEDRWTTEFARLADELGSIEDPRDRRGLLHPLVTVLAIPILAMLCGRDGADAAHRWGLKNEKWLGTFLPLPNGVPSQDAILRLYAAVDTRALEHAFVRWMGRFSRPSGENRQLAIDGQSLRRGGQGLQGDEKVHSLSALDCESGLVVGRRTTDSKSNEISTIPEVLRMLDLSGALVSIDAMGCQVEIAETVRKRGGDYLFALKGNHPHLQEEAKVAFEDGLRPGRRPADQGPHMKLHRELVSSQHSAGHGRLDERKAFLFRRSDNPDVFDAWLPAACRFPDLDTVIRIDSTRTDRGTGKSSRETRFYISSRRMTAGVASEAVRKHWLVENQLHWVLDVTFGADQCRIRTKNAAANFACARQIALCLLRRHNGDRMSISARRELCGDWPEYLAWVLDSI